MKQLRHVNPDPVINLPARIRKTPLTAVITIKTVIREQSVLKVNTLIRKQNIVKTSVRLDARIQMTFHNADSAKTKEKYYNRIVSHIPSVEMETQQHSHVGRISILMS
jgi:hypothetical protein